MLQVPIFLVKGANGQNNEHSEASIWPFYDHFEKLEI